MRTCLLIGALIGALIGGAPGVYCLIYHPDMTQAAVWHAHWPMMVLGFLILWSSLVSLQWTKSNG